MSDSEKLEILEKIKGYTGVTLGTIMTSLFLPNKLIAMANNKGKQNSSSSTSPTGGDATSPTGGGNTAPTGGSASNPGKMGQKIFGAFSGVIGLLALTNSIWYPCIQLEKGANSHGSISTPQKIMLTGGVVIAYIRFGGSVYSILYGLSPTSRPEGETLNTAIQQVFTPIIRMGQVVFNIFDFFLTLQEDNQLPQDKEFNSPEDVFDYMLENIKKYWPKLIGTLGLNTVNSGFAVCDLVKIDEKIKKKPRIYVSLLVIRAALMTAEVEALLIETHNK